MGTFDAMHQRYERVIRMAHIKRFHTIECASVGDTKRLRMGFYNFAKYLRKVVDNGPGKDFQTWQWAGELLKIYEQLIFKSHKNGVLEISVRIGMRDEMLIDRSLAMLDEEKRPTHEQLMNMYAEVEAAKLGKSVEEMNIDDNDPIVEVGGRTMLLSQLNKEQRKIKKMMRKGQINIERNEENYNPKDIMNMLAEDMSKKED